MNSVGAKDKGSCNLGGISRGPGRAAQVRNMDHFNCVIELPRLPALAPAYVSFNLYTIKLFDYSLPFHLLYNFTMLIICASYMTYQHLPFVSFLLQCQCTFTRGLKNCG